MMIDPTLQRAMTAYEEICCHHAEMISILDINNIQTESINSEDAANFERAAELLKQAVSVMEQYQINATDVQ